MRGMSDKNQKSPAGEAAGELGFDQRLESLETLVAELEDGGLELEQAIGRYQQGIALLKSCHATLGEYRQRVEELSEEAGVTLAAMQDPDLDGEA